MEGTGTNARHFFSEASTDYSGKSIDSSVGARMAQYVRDGLSQANSEIKTRAFSGIWIQRPTLAPDIETYEHAIERLDK